MKQSPLVKLPKNNPKIEILSDESIMISSGKCSLTFHPDGHIIFKGKKISLDANNILMNADRVDICS